MAEDRKRKRLVENFSSRHNKTRVFDTPFVDINVTSVVKPHFTPPVIATTPGIEIPVSVHFQAYAKREAAQKRKAGGSKHSQLKELLLHCKEHERMEYTAREDRPHTLNKLLKHYIGAYDEKTGEMQIMEARKMVVRGAVQARKAEDDAMKTPSFQMKMSEMRTNLGEEFGTRKAKKALKSNIDNAIMRDPDKWLDAAEMALMDVVQESAAHIRSQEELQAIVDHAKPVPRANLQAESVREVYDPAQIIGRDVLNAVPVLDWQEKTKNREEILVPSRYVANRIASVAADEDSWLKLRLLRYLLFVLVFWAKTIKYKGKDVRRKVAKQVVLRDAMAPAPTVVIDSIRRKFSQNGEMRKFHIDLLMTHCCVFALLIDNFATNTYDLREDLKLEQKELNSYYAELGTRVRSTKKGEKGDQIAKLTLPLDFPKMRKGRR